MHYILVRVFSYSIVPAAVLGLIRCRRIDPAYYPFLFLVWLGLIAEVVTDFITAKTPSNALSTNIYVLIEFLLIIWLFKKLSLFERKPLTFYILGIFFILVWLVDNFILSGLKTGFCSYFIISFSFAAVMMSVSMINILLARERKSVLRNGAFLICVAFILYHTCSALVEIFWLYGLTSSDQFKLAVTRIHTYVNIVVNLIYALAILWIPRKHGYLLQS